MGTSKRKQLPVEIVCDHCKSNYHYECDDHVKGYLVPDGLRIPDLPRKHDFTLEREEKIIKDYSLEKLEKILEEIKAAKRGSVKNIKNMEASKLARIIAPKSTSSKKIASHLQNIIHNYWKIKESCDRKQTNEKEYLTETSEYNKIRKQLYPITFKCVSQQDSETHQKANEKLSEYVEKHPEKDLEGLQVDLTWEKDFTNLYWDTMRVVKCTDSHHLLITRFGSEKKIVKKYLCICQMCGREEEYISSDFVVRENGPVACCSCHTTSPYEAKTMAILNELGVFYIREKSFEGLLGEKGGKLRFDFALYRKCDQENNPQIDLMIEMQGTHHFEKGFYDENRKYIKNKLDEDSYRASEADYARQRSHDQKKKEFCMASGISLECVSVENYESLEKKLVEILCQYGYEYYEEKEDYVSCFLRK